MTVVFSHQTALQMYFDNPALALSQRVEVDVARRVRQCDVAKLAAASEGALDVLVKASALRGPGSRSLRYHVLPTVCLREAFIRVGDFALASPELCFLQMASDLDVVDLILLGYRLCGDYRRSELRFRTGELPLTTVDRLRAFLEACPGCKGVKKARRALEYVLPGSNSTMETRLTMALILPRRWGGYGLSRPALNQELCGTDRKGDLCWLDKGLVVEYDSRAHHQGVSAQELDSARRTEIGLLDLQVITVSRLQVEDPRLFDAVARYIAKSLGESTASRSPSCLPARKQLLDRLFHHFDEEKTFMGKTK